jgi:hypothetical protein
MRLMERPLFFTRILRFSSCQFIVILTTIIPFTVALQTKLARGAGKKGGTLLLPLAPGATWSEHYKPVLEEGMRRICEFGAQ